jgi:hypothetical protein
MKKQGGPNDHPDRLQILYNRVNSNYYPSLTHSKPAGNYRAKLDNHA